MTLSSKGGDTVPPHFQKDPIPGRKRNYPPIDQDIGLLKLLLQLLEMNAELFRRLIFCFLFMFFLLLRICFVLILRPLWPVVLFLSVNYAELFTLPGRDVNRLYVKKILEKNLHWIRRLTFVGRFRTNNDFNGHICGPDFCG